MDAFQFLSEHHGEVLIALLTLMVIIGLLILVPQLLRSSLRKAEMIHLEQMKALEQGIPISQGDERSRVAGHTAMLVPMVIVICAGTVTCFVSASKNDNMTAVVMTVWAVAGVVSLAAITGGVALIGRLAQLQSDDLPEEEPNPLDAPPG
jgi:cytochrome bd-type quinol oxidase subunit 2